MLIVLGVALVLVVWQPAWAQERAREPDAASRWELRLDEADAPLEGALLMPLTSGVHVTTGPAVVFRPSDVMTGSYRVAASVVQMRAARPPAGYGLFIGGVGLGGSEVRYTSFLIRQDGRFSVVHQTGVDARLIVRWTDHQAVRRLEAGSRSSNALAVEVGGDQVRFVVNGREVVTVPRGQLHTEGVAGIRLTDRLDLHVDGFEVR